MCDATAFDARSARAQLKWRRGRRAIRADGGKGRGGGGRFPNASIASAGYLRAASA
jgi:hypothetical protein